MKADVRVRKDYSKHFWWLCREHVLNIYSYSLFSRGLDSHFFISPPSLEMPFNLIHCDFHCIYELSDYSRSCRGGKRQCSLLVNCKISTKNALPSRMEVVEPTFLKLNKMKWGILTQWMIWASHGELQISSVSLYGRLVIDRHRQRNRMPPTWSSSKIFFVTVVSHQRHRVATRTEGEQRQGPFGCWKREKVVTRGSKAWKCDCLEIDWE